MLCRAGWGSKSRRCRCSRIIVLGQQVQVLYVIELDCQAAHQVQGAVVLQVGLGVVDKYLIAFTIVKGFVLFTGNPQAAIDPISAAADGL